MNKVSVLNPIGFLTKRKTLLVIPHFDFGFDFGFETTRIRRATSLFERRWLYTYMYMAFDRITDVEDDVTFDRQFMQLLN